MKRKTILEIAGLFILIMLLYQNCNNNGSASYTPKAEAVACNAPTTWFPHAQTPAPEEGKYSAFAKAATTSNCDFHQWSWQKFLYLTRTKSPHSTELNFADYIQVDNEMNPLGKTIILDDTTQAGSHSTLFDKTNRAIFYAIHLNKQMFDFTSMYLQLFVNNCKINDTTINQNKLNALGYDTITFPVGSTEIKTSWILASSINVNDLKNYYVTTGKLKTTGKTVNIALLGMHIITRVQNHPEFIWATFEHDFLAPYAIWPKNYLNDSIPDSNQVLSPFNHLFYKANTKLYQNSVRPYANGVPNPPTNVFRGSYHLYQNGTQPKFKGMILQKEDSINLVNTQSLNASVKNFLKNEKSKWQNYTYVGAVWIDPVVAKLKPGDQFIGALSKKNLRGSRANTNITMETFAQLDWSYPNPSPPPKKNGKTTPGNSMNCFGCHFTANFNVNKNDTNGAEYNLALSHLFNNRLATLLKKKNK